ncbi:hypothetical protein CORC01_10230 [Colletotrichum orchidophilum]|uniref:Uncharacterized protein n=1 Tax=Colletotrichum orchidophilum TaxID=1209926 RepID=A0A1G4AZB5_9PEZI|nr:uncharacterized protein CORC01_10230 [Colletotrichum orchidophilum]OHE94510.1 hypothetical protein CORC01_10230 [Colletotrichum orchidophilum]
MRLFCKGCWCDNPWAACVCSVTYPQRLDPCVLQTEQHRNSHRESVVPKSLFGISLA